MFCFTDHRCKGRFKLAQSFLPPRCLPPHHPAVAGGFSLFQCWNDWNRIFHLWLIVMHFWGGVSAGGVWAAVLSFYCNPTLNLSHWSYFPTPTPASSSSATAVIFWDGSLASFPGAGRSFPHWVQALKPTGSWFGFLVALWWFVANNEPSQPTIFQIRSPLYTQFHFAGR